MNKLQQAIEDGKAEVRRLQEIKNKELADKLEKEKIQYEQYVKYWFDKLTKDDYLFTLIKNAIIDGKKSFALDNADYCAVRAIINNPDIFAGIHAQHQTFTVDMSDDCRNIEHEHVIITWDEK